MNIDLATIRGIRDEVRLGEGGAVDWRAAGGQCGVVSEELAVRFGWVEYHGFYRRADGTVEEHAWNRLPDGGILDATADQWEEGREIRILARDDPDFARYMDEPPA